MAENIREVLDGLQFQGTGESVSYGIDTLPWGGTPTSQTHDIFDEEDYTASLKSTLMDGTPTINGDVINLPALSGLSDGVIYRIFVQFTSGGNILEGFFRVEGQR